MDRMMMMMDKLMMNIMLMDIFDDEYNADGQNDVE